MNLDLDFSVFSRFFRGIVTELRQKRLWPVVALLVVALVAIPFLLSKSSNPAPAPQAALPVSPPPAGTSIPTLNVQTTPSHSPLNGPARNPFGTGGSPASGTAAARTSSATTATSTAVSTAVQNTVSTVSGNSSGGSSTLPTVSSSVSTGSATPVPTFTRPSTTPVVKSTPPVLGLAADQAYEVSLAITNGSGGLNTVDSLKRLSALPSSHQPLLVELGVLKGGHRVLFAVEPGTVVSGGGSCIPGRIECEILSLAANETESATSSNGSAATIFEVTSISKQTYASSTAAAKARQTRSVSGQAVLVKSAPTALSLFRYEPSLGAVIDLRNLSVSR